MEKKKFLKLASLIAGICFLLTIGNNMLSAQCATWTANPNAEKIIEWHTIYRGDIKAKNFTGAMEFWQKAYDAAPAADGKRDFHYTDGIEIYKSMLEGASEDDKKKYIAKIDELHKAREACFLSGTIKMKGCTDEACIKSKKIGFYAGRMAFDQFYTYNSSYDDVLINLETAVNNMGNDIEYIVLEPYANIAVFQFSSKIWDKHKTRGVYEKLLKLADHNVKNNEKFKSQFEASQARMVSKFKEIENHIFDCEYFVNKVKDHYGEKITDPVQMEETIRLLKRQGCVAGEPYLDQLEKDYARYASQLNAQRQAEFEANNPAMLAKKAYDSGDYAGAISKYNEAISKAPDKAAEYHFRIASILFRKQKKYSAARSEANKAININPNMGKAYMLIGDMYASTSRNCGSDGYSRGIAVIAAINKYNKAKSVDPNVAGDASERARKYSSSLPLQDDAFMRGKKKGDSVKCPCWIGETVALRFQ